MRNSARKASLAAITALALALAACGGDDDDEGGDTGSGDSGDGDTGEATGGEFSTYIGEPENPLIPGNTNETEGGQIVDSLFTGLVTYNSDTYEMEFNGVAESIESDDQQTWTVTLKDGWTFHDGSPVTAESFVDAWNWTAYGPNGAGNSYFFANIEGYDELQGVVETDDEGNTEVVEEPSAEEMSGLEVVDERTFTVTLKDPFSIFPMTTGYTAFYPLPEAFFEDEEAFGRQPIGNGPFMANEEFVPGQGITLDRYEDYAGDDAAQADRVELRVYADENTGYTDVQAGNLDISDTLPVSAIGTGPDEWGDRWVESPRGDMTPLAFPTYDERYSDPRVRQAFAMAINREAITEAIFEGSRTPANSWASPVVEGYREDACEFNTFDPDRANELLDETDFDRSEPIDLWFNSGAGHDQWVEAVGNQLRDNLGISDYNLESLDFAEYLPLRDDQGMTGPYRAGWVMDYPHIQNFLEPLYSESALPPAGANDTYFTNEEFDSLISEANQADDPDEAVSLYQQAEDILCQEMPSTPLFYGVNQLVHTERVDNVTINAFSRIELQSVTVVE
ncbi:peptide ABC transporter substrate-binding protein [Phytoactinopolyspora halotolerans]|uniref:ABC transporter substrate-binding protein n=1 Tax=Phytoactinopolyspora halotolerans TaxID=1981512 RepID=A0A6L9S8D8_9ACTN|nr:ABC transporter substrate-binding protein [Phytoactinopolyspora halotolerans]NEE01293.1 ABC transporter substrate-binding protein [Phytoactinopolyspora halotolerans]